MSAIQLREKDLSDAEYIKLAEPFCTLCHAYSAELFINSRIEIAMEVGADGLHLPGDSASVRKVVERTNHRFIIGSSVHTLTEAQQRETEGADFITYSPIYPTLSKPGYGPVVGLDGLRNVTEGVNIPVFALGGITPERVSECLDAGAYGVAVMSRGDVTGERCAAGEGVSATAIGVTTGGSGHETDFDNCWLRFRGRRRDSS